MKYIFVRFVDMIYNARDALEDCEAFASLIDHHHVPHHITVGNIFTYDYAVSKCDFFQLSLNIFKKN